MKKIVIAVAFLAITCRGWAGDECPWYRITSASDGVVTIYRIGEKLDGKWTPKGDSLYETFPGQILYHYSHLSEAKPALSELCTTRLHRKDRQRIESLYKKMQNKKWRQVKP